MVAVRPNFSAHFEETILRATEIQTDTAKRYLLWLIGQAQNHPERGVIMKFYSSAKGTLASEVAYAVHDMHSDASPNSIIPAEEKTGFELRSLSAEWSNGFAIYCVPHGTSPHDAVEIEPNFVSISHINLPGDIPVSTQDTKPKQITRKNPRLVTSPPRDLVPLRMG